jgi:hypothetical protein
MKSLILSSSPIEPGILHQTGHGQGLLDEVQGTNAQVFFQAEDEQGYIIHPFGLEDTGFQFFPTETPGSQGPAKARDHAVPGIGGRDNDRREEPGALQGIHERRDMPGIGTGVAIPIEIQIFQCNRAGGIMHGSLLQSLALHGPEQAVERQRSLELPLHGSLEVGRAILSIAIAEQK